MFAILKLTLNSCEEQGFQRRFLGTPDARLRARRRENASRSPEKNQTHDRRTFFQSSVFEAHFDRAFHALKREHTLGRPSKKEKQKPNCSITFLPKEKKKKKQTVFGRFGRKLEPYLKRRLLDHLGFISRLQESLHPIYLQSLPLFIFPSLPPEPFYLKQKTVLRSPSLLSLHLSRALSFPFPSLHSKTAPAPFASTLHRKTETAPAPFASTLHPKTGLLLLLLFFFFLINSKGRSLDLPLPLAPCPLPTVPCSTSSFFFN